MSALDQAFIRAYAQPNPAPAATAADSAGKASLAEALREQPSDALTEPRTVLSRERVLAALVRPSSRQSEPPALPLRPLPSPARRHDAPHVNKVAPSAALRGGGCAKKPQAGPIANGTAAPTLGDLDLCDLFRRLEQPRAAVPMAAARPQAVPRPHLSVIAAESPATSADGECPTVEEVPAAHPVSPPAADDSSPPDHAPVQFHWPTLCSRLIEAAGSQLDQLGEVLLARKSLGQKVLGIAGCGRGQGTTTVLLCVARRLAERGYRVVMVDANPLDAQLARQLCVEPQQNPQSASAGETTSAATVLESADGRLALFPAGGPFLASAAVLDDGTGSAESLATSTAPYDVVLVDLGPLETMTTPSGPSRYGLGARVDAAVLVQDVRVTEPEHLAEAERHLAAAGVTIVGVVQNYAPE